MTKAQLVYFSPTGTTKKVLEAVAEGMEINTPSVLDLTLPAEGVQDSSTDEGIALIGFPVYAGRIAPVAKERLQEYAKGNGRKAVLVAVYGNRAFEDALLEMHILAEELDFKPIAAAAFIGEHSFSTTEKPIAASRPDTDDLKIAREFGKNVAVKAAAAETTPLSVPGNLPHRDGVQPAPIAPEVTDACTVCGECATVCPTGAITIADAGTTDVDKCILCCACVRACPSNARVMKAEGIMKIQDFLYTQHSDRKIPEVFF